MTTCSRCFSPVPDPAEQWPDDDDGTLCQECWERECSRSWWVMVRALGDAGECLTR
jgi:hypothetical protein